MQGFGAEFVKEYVKKTGFDGAFNVGEFWTDLKCALHLQSPTTCRTYITHNSMRIDFGACACRTTGHRPAAERPNVSSMSFLLCHPPQLGL